MKIKSMSILFSILMLVSFQMTAQQIQMPQASPVATLTQKVGLTDITVNYSRPGQKKRKIFGELVPYGEVWRTGANAATMVEFSTDVSIEGRKLGKGSYALYSIPNKDRWTIIFSKDTKLWGAVGYDSQQDALRVTVKPEKSKTKHETMQISFVDLTDTGASLAINWDRTAVKIRIETEVDPIVMKQIQEMVIDKDSASPGLYYQAATYYYTNDKDLHLALEWIEKSVKEDPRYWTTHLKAKIELALGKKEEAKSSAMESMELANEAKNMDYVSLNERLIKSIK